MAENTQSSAGRITVALAKPTQKALVHMHEVLGLNKTDAVNQALRVYDFLLTIAETDGAIRLKRMDGQVELLVLVH